MGRAGRCSPENGGDLHQLAGDLFCRFSHGAATRCFWGEFLRFDPLAYGGILGVLHLFLLKRGLRAPPGHEHLGLGNGLLCPEFFHGTLCPRPFRGLLLVQWLPVLHLFPQCDAMRPNFRSQIFTGSHFGTFSGLRLDSRRAVLFRGRGQLPNRFAHLCPVARRLPLDPMETLTSLPQAGKSTLLPPGADSLRHQHFGPRQ